MILPDALLVAGPTASGKSALALALAERLRGATINADSMQVYRELRALTARPTLKRGTGQAHVTREYWHADGRVPTLPPCQPPPAGT